MNEANIYIYIWNTESLKLIKFDRDRCKSVNIANSTQISTKFYQTLKEEKKNKNKIRSTNARWRRETVGSGGPESTKAERGARSDGIIGPAVDTCRHHPQRCR